MSHQNQGTDARYYGKYRGTVFNNIDPEQRGRIMAIVPDVLGLIPSSWALPCAPIAGKQNGVYVVPKIGDGVWIEFEQGDPDYPIWVGVFGGSRLKFHWLRQQETQLLRASSFSRCYNRLLLSATCRLLYPRQLCRRLRRRVVSYYAALRALISWSMMRVSLSIMAKGLRLKC